MNRDLAPLAFRPDRMSVPVKPSQPALARARKPMSFETALRYLRRGKAVRRRAWHSESKIFRLGKEVFLKLPASFGQSQGRPAKSPDYGSRPDFWLPYPSDFLANDWEIAR